MRLALLLMVYGISAIPLAVLGFTILLNQKSDNTKRLFSAFCLSLSLWTFLLLLTDLSSDPASRLSLLNTANMIQIYIPLLFLMFCSSFLGLRLIIPITFAWCVAIILEFGNYNNLIIKSVHIGFGAQPDQTGSLYFVQILNTIVFLLISLIILYVGTKNENLKRNQVRFITLGLGLSVLIKLAIGLGMTALGLKSWVGLIGPPTILFFTLSVYYAIARFRIMDIRPYVARISAYIISVSIIIGGLTLIRLIIETTFSELVIKNLLNFICLTIILACYPKILLNFQKQSSKLFFREYFEPSEALFKISSLLSFERSNEVLTKKASEFITSLLQVESVLIHIIGKKYTSSVTATVGTNDLSNEQISKLSNLASKHQGWIEHQENRSISKEYSRIEVVIPLEINRRYCGYIAVGLKRSGTLLQDKDLKFLKVFSKYLASATQNIQSFEEILHFSETLKKEVEKATRQLKRVNIQLYNLSNAKDEFIFMASHQLKPQLAAAAGFVELLGAGLDDQSHKKNKKENIKLLKLTKESITRMNRVVSVMLNGSHIQTGRFNLIYSEFNLSQLIFDEIKSLKHLADQKAIKFEYLRPQSKVQIKADKLKLPEVIINFLSNAVQYSKTGSVIKVALSESNKFIEFTVSDSGIGVSVSDQTKLFSKFFRSENAKKARPIGTGLGLFVAKKIIEAHLGQIIFRSVENQGSVFGFKLPK